jgi:hypothetical protein
MAAITVQDLTQGQLTGTGVFDELMRATKAHLAYEYKAGHIKGSEYATVYLGALQSVMSQSLQLLLQQQQVDLQAQLLTEQIVTERLNQAQTVSQTALVDQQFANAIIEGTVLLAQECKLSAEFNLIQEQTLKTISETALLAQKKVTEQAQTSGAGVAPESVIGRQSALYDAQRDGYRRDAEQKAAKLMADTWNVRKTMDDSTPVDDRNKLGDIYIGQAVTKLLEGINIPVA